jgi:hypothetical protein
VLIFLFSVLQAPQIKYRTEFTTGKKVILFYHIFLSAWLTCFAPGKFELVCSLRLLIKNERGIYHEGLFFTRPGELLWERNPLRVFSWHFLRLSKYEEAMSMN